MYDDPMTGALHIVLPVGAVFALAGLVKGVTGMGLPTVAIGLLGAFMRPAEAAALLFVPSLVTNVWQFAAGPARARALQRLWPMLVALALATWSASGLIAGGDTALIMTGLGLALVAYGLLGLSRMRLALPPGAEPWLAPLVGAATGIVTGATGVFVIPALPYLQALGLEKEDLVQALGLSFTVSTLALALGLVSHGAFRPTALGFSVLCTVPALLGMFLGQWFRLRVDPATFRMVFFVGLLALGTDLAIRSGLG